MTKKFTEEEYQKIVEIADKYFEQQKSTVTPVVIRYIYNDLFSDKTVENEKIRGLSQEVVLIALPKTRDWAHEKFVEKEKKYYWEYKKKDDEGYAWGLQKLNGLIKLRFIKYSLLTKKEVIEAGYNPDMFDKKEVE